MSERLRNNLFAFVVVFAFWCISFSAIAADPIVSESTQTINSNSKNETKVESPPPSPYMNPSDVAMHSAMNGASGSDGPLVSPDDAHKQ